MYVTLDQPKERANLKDHGFSLLEIVRVLADVNAIIWIDDRENYGEERLNALALLDLVVVHATFIEIDDETVHPISLRRATSHEQRAYYRQEQP